VKNKEILEKILILLSKRDYSEKEIIEKFPSISFSLLEKLKREKFIDDYKLSKKIIESLQEKGKGFFYILNELERRKIDKNIIERIKKEYDMDGEVERCRRILEKLKNKKNIQTLIMNLKSRGFSDEVIEKVIHYF
jgi:SOS response regulatory protein OraA/RecX